MANTTTDVSRLTLAHPDQGYDGGATLHGLVRTAWTKIGNNMPGRYAEYTGVGNSETLELSHGLGVGIEELTVLIYAGVGDSKTRVNHASSPDISEYTIQEKAGDEETTIEVITPAASSPSSISIVVLHGRQSEKTAITFNTTTDWGSASGGYYTQTIAQTLHRRGTNPVVQIFELDGSDYVLTTPDKVWHDSTSGDVSFRVPDDPDLRFAGKVIIS
jgi:hypothetical protein